MRKDGKKTSSRQRGPTGVVKSVMLQCDKFRPETAGLQWRRPTDQFRWRADALIASVSIGKGYLPEGRLSRAAVRLQFRVPRMKG
jgi:hypothetical protein